MSDSESGSQKERDDSQPSRRCRFAYKPCHLIALVRQVAAENPFQYASGSAQDKAWESIRAALKEAGIKAQARSNFLKVRKLLDDQDKKMSKLPKSGTEKQYKELKQLLEELAFLRKEEARHHAEEAAKAPAVPAAKKSSRKARGVTEVQQGKNIRDASMNMMKRRRGKLGSSSDDGDTDGEEEHEINGHMGVNTRNPNRKAEHGKTMLIVSNDTGHRPEAIDWLTFCRLLPRPNKSTNRQLAFQEAQLAEQKAAREEAAALRIRELELETIKTKARIKSDQEKDALLSSVLRRMMDKMS
ncbi:hypothetical protein RvY_16682 [Ramazzottius varieornatus]|uniref:Uncharacterized protein n=1 Tax=Ramazzottius varieornatus TaxID=947166 RepID=A0A1D1VZE2_RAMVA|nr:hypothetical protein RvY_16682 [Ramazzottius varieornatus]